MPEPDTMTKAKIVYLILNRETEQALQMLSSFYRVKPPEVTVGTVKGKRRTAYAVYVPKERKIYAMNADIFYNPFVMLHEFYHHLRTQGGPHRGTERHADLYAHGFINSYKAVLDRVAKDRDKNQPGPLSYDVKND
ncbi:MAG: hypothetical protein ACREAY_00365 [Nitrososphaera sp.]|uniref:hypothetical protein n=1 Tax=Nitrososphaera sp. TaxID=1971748 RepID=UPI003D6F0767